MDSEESYPEGTVHSRVMMQLEEFVKEWQSMGEEEESDQEDLQLLVEQVESGEGEEGDAE
jgi:hypothetical protein